MKTAADDLKSDIMKFKKEGKALDSDTKKVVRDSLKGLKDNMSKLGLA